MSVARRMVTGRADAALPPPPATRGAQPPPGDVPLDEAQRRTAQAKVNFPTGGNPVLQESPIDESEVDAWADSLAGAKRVDLDEPDTSVDLESADHVDLHGLGAPEHTDAAPSEALRPAPEDRTSPGADFEADEESTQPVAKDAFAAAAQRADFSDGTAVGGRHHAGVRYGAASDRCQRGRSRWATAIRPTTWTRRSRAGPSR